MAREQDSVKRRSKYTVPIAPFLYLTQDRCKKCQGKRVTKVKKRVEFQIDPGTENGERIALKGEGDEAVRIVHLSSITTRSIWKLTFLAGCTCWRCYFPYSSSVPPYFQALRECELRSIIHISQDQSFRSSTRILSCLLHSSGWQGDTYRG